MPRRISIFGSTGSIGTNSVDVVKAHADQFDVRVLSGFRNTDLLIAQALALKPEMVVTGMASDEARIRDALPGVQVLSGIDGLNEAAALPVDITLCAIVGMAGLPPVMKAIARGGLVAFASKECLVSAGQFMMQAARDSGATLLPVDSEHNALFQVFDATQRGAITRIVLTASGGPFRDWHSADIQKATVEQAVAHPNWSMGAKISVDSASMMNKALEVIEAAELFTMPSEQIDVLVHPQSLVHGMVEYCDGSVLAQMGPADMRTAITYCLGWPQRMKTSGPMLDFSHLSQLTFHAPDTERFPCLRIGREVLNSGLPARVIMNAANEMAVAAFLNRQISFGRIPHVIETALNTCDHAALNSLDDVVALDHTVRQIMETTIIKKVA